MSNLPNQLREQSTELYMLMLQRHYCADTTRAIQGIAESANKTADLLDGRWVVRPLVVFFAAVAGGLLFAGAVYIIFRGM